MNTTTKTTMRDSRGTPTGIGVQHLDHLNLRVADLEETKEWYRRVFEFEEVEHGLYEGRPWAILKSGAALLCLYEHPEPLPEGINHFALRISDADAWEARVKREKLEVRYGGVYRYPFSSSWYVTDPTGYGIEVVRWDEDIIRFG
jgi:catechol 2,3-dioxygenase-like lactoylglutathione lyase family enzyme